MPDLRISQLSSGTPTSGSRLVAVVNSTAMKVTCKEVVNAGLSAPSSGAILTYSSATSLPAWSKPTSGSVLVGSSVGTPTWTAAGGAGKILQSTGSVAAWVSPIKYMNINAFSTVTALASGPAAYFQIPPDLNGYNLTYISGTHYSSAASAGQTEFTLYNVTDASSMCTSWCEISSGVINSSATASQAVIDAAKDDVATGDLLRLDVKVIPSASAPKGLGVTLGFSLP